ncbi:hypothetical protein [Nocardioides sp. PD653]|uniref:hypothetical protein n=1 Tax=Nocardioides sp. PD653 TaxID=393303 RepID=UPI0009F10F80|nr:hypothetical protein [Nocardioides sp. PD653]GAW54740.1 uncharacterized protein PD653_2154 [Nocardioides sp. PD653]
MADPTFTYDVSTPAGQVRLLLNDIPAAEGAQGTAVFSDAEIDAFLTLERSSVKRAAAQAIDTNATNEALASKVLRTQDLSTDGAKVADAMRKHAAALRAQADQDDEADDAGFVLVSVVPGCQRPPELTEYPRNPRYPFC